MTFSLSQFGATELYKRVQKRGDRLAPLADLLNWERFRTLLLRRAKRGRPPFDQLMMFKTLVIQFMYGLSDEEMEYQICNRLDFQQFLGFPKEVPDHTTIWRFREYLSEADLHDVLWDEFFSQLKKKDIELSKGVIQDATFITANPGKTNSSDKKDRGRGQPSTRNEDGTWTKKGKKSYFGYKLHAKVDSKHGIVTEIAVTTAKVDDRAIDLTKLDENAYLDKGYVGAKIRAKGKGIMKKKPKGKPMPWKDKHRNKRITRTRAKGERPFAVIKNVLKGGHTLYTELHRVFTQQFLTCFIHNLLQLKRLT